MINLVALAFILMSFVSVARGETLLNLNVHQRVIYCLVFVGFAVQLIGSFMARVALENVLHMEVARLDLVGFRRPILQPVILFCVSSILTLGARLLHSTIHGAVQLVSRYLNLWLRLHNLFSSVSFCTFYRTMYHGMHNC
jgi:hypothetical protein